MMSNNIEVTIVMYIILVIITSIIIYATKTILYPTLAVKG